MTMMGSPLLLLLALALDGLVGDPDWLWRRLPHPVVLIGRLIGWLDQTLNNEGWRFSTRRAAGVVAALIVAGVAGGVGVALVALSRALPWGGVIEVVAVAVLLAQRSLYEHVARVADGFDTGGLDEARRQVSMIVGRDPQSLDGAGVCRAAVETTAENFSDGIVAPAFWYLVGGLPGICVYKAINTADSMIGHKSPRHLAFGWAAARTDDLLNLVPARLSALLFAVGALLVGGSPHGAVRAALRDASSHRSPNAGWPEAAMAGAFGFALAGPRRYGGTVVDDGWMNDGGRTDLVPADIRRGLRLLVAGCATGAAVVALYAVFLV